MIFHKNDRVVVSGSKYNVISADEDIAVLAPMTGTKTTFKDMFAYSNMNSLCKAEKILGLETIHDAEGRMRYPKNLIIELVEVKIPVPIGLDVALDQVKAFHIAFSHPIGHFPQMMNPVLTSQRAGYINEEVVEMIESDDIYEQIDASLDQIYFSLGNLVCNGVLELQPLFDIVQNANMSKLWEDGKPRYWEHNNKVKKPATWVDPKPLLKAEIDRQIAEGLRYLELDYDYQELNE